VPEAPRTRTASATGASPANLVTTTAILTRSEPSPTAPRLQRLEKWTRVKVSETSPDGAWYRLSFAGQDVGYVPADAVGPEVKPTDFIVEAMPVQAQFTRRAVVIRAAPTIESTRITVLPEGKRLTLNGRVNDGEWYRVVQGGRVLGFVQGRFMSPESDEER
jgi:hypothetical protein